MEFLKSCSSGLYTLDGWSNISYCCCSINPGLGIQELLELSRLEQSLWSQNYICFTDLKGHRFWLFGSSNGSSKFRELPDNVEELIPNLKILFTGTFNASDIASPEFTPSKPSLLDQSTDLPSLEIYNHFITAFKATTCSTLSKSSKITTLATDLYLYSDSSDDSHIPHILLRSCSYLTSSGILVFTLYLIEKSTYPDLVKLSSDSVVETDDIVLLIPGLVSASLIEPNVINQYFLNNQRWCEALISWFTYFGLSVPDWKTPKSWILVSIIHSSLEAPTPMLWPRCFCLTNIDISHSVNFLNTEWFRDQGGFTNWLNLAQAWNITKDERQMKIAKAQQKRNPTTKEFLVSASPANIRFPGIEPYDATLYPTPPDPPSYAPIPLSTANTPLPPAESLGQSNISNEKSKVIVTGSPSAWPQTPIQPNSIQLGSNDLDEDEFMNDVTDADFNFFDEPDEIEFKKPEIPDRNQVEDEDKDCIMQSDDNQDENDAHAPVEKDDEMSDPVLIATPPVSKPKINHLTPAEVQRRLFDMKIMSKSPTNNYDPIIFSPSLTKSDNKYLDSGFFGYTSSRKEKNNSHANINDKSKSRSTALPKDIRNISDDSDENDDDDGDYNDDDENGGFSSQSVMSIDEDPASMKLLSLNDIVIPNSPLDQVQLQHVLSIDILKDLFTHHHISPLFNLSHKLAALREQNFFHQFSTLITRRDSYPFIFVAQLIMDQTTLSSINSYIGFNNNQIERDYTKLAELKKGNTILSEFHNNIKSILGTESLQDLIKFSSLQDGSYEKNGKFSSKPITSKVPPGKADATIFGTPTRLNPPSICLRRNDALWELSPTSIPFWDVLGLAPYGGPKNIVSYTICPSNRALMNILEGFLKEFGVCYESSRLGEHVLGDFASNEQGDDGIIPWNLPSGFDELGASSAKENGIEDGLREATSSLLFNLTAYRQQKTSESRLNSNKPIGSFYTFVIYIINPFEEDPRSIELICSVFWDLFTSYSNNAKAPSVLAIPDLQLQIIPLSFIAKKDQLVFKQNNELVLLAREVYNRCPPSDLPDNPVALPITTGWSIQLAEPLPRKISFELKTDAPSNILYDNSQFHVAYAISSSGNWVSAAFTDNTGRYQCNACYCLSGGSSTLATILKEIWETCIEIMQTRKVTWRLYIAKIGKIDTRELDAWNSVSSRQQNISLITSLLSIDLSPCLAIISPTQAKISLNTENGKFNTITPASTPNPVVSPDASVSTPVATPTDQVVNESSIDPEAQLIDNTDETYSIILAHRPLLEMAPGDHRQSISSGLMLKIPPSSPTPNPFNAAEILDTTNINCIAIHSVWARSQLKTENFDKAWSHASMIQKSVGDTNLKEIMSLYRDLALLAKVRDLKDWKGGLLPWHILVASKGAEALDGVYGMKRL